MVSTCCILDCFTSFFIVGCMGIFRGRSHFLLLTRMFYLVRVPYCLYIMLDISLLLSSASSSLLGSRVLSSSPVSSFSFSCYSCTSLPMGAFSNSPFSSSSVPSVAFSILIMGSFWGSLWSFCSVFMFCCTVGFSYNPVFSVFVCISFWCTPTSW